MMMQGTYNEQGTGKPSGSHGPDDDDGQGAEFDLEISSGKSNSRKQDLDSDRYTCNRKTNE
jgi:hypothetical protein